MKYTTGIILTLLLGGLSYLFIQLTENFLINSSIILILPDYKYQPIYFIIITGLIALAVIGNKKISNKNSLFSVFLLYTISLVLTYFSVSRTIDYQISPFVKNQFLITFKNFFYLPSLLIIIIITERILSLLKPKMTSLKVHQLKVNKELKSLRGISYIIDLIITILIYKVLHHLGILYSHTDILLVLFCYRFLFEITFSKTVGKYLLKIQITSTKGKNIDYSNIIYRNLVRIMVIYWIPLLLKQKPIHDRTSNTTVIKE